MIKDNQKILIYVPRRNLVEWYCTKGYKCKCGDTIEIEAKDISLGSKKTVEYVCDICGANFFRTPCSNQRAKKESQIDTCPFCSRERARFTCLERYGVDNAMKKEEFQKKCEASKEKINFIGSVNYTSSGFEKGIPVSAAQYRIAKQLPNFELNYQLGKYYIDLFYNGIAIEYDGKGHDFSVRLGKISLEQFEQKEKDKIQFICKNSRLLKIKDRSDKVKKQNFNIDKLMEEIKNFIESDDLYREIEIK